MNDALIGIVEQLLNQIPIIDDCIYQSENRKAFENITRFLENLIMFIQKAEENKTLKQSLDIKEINKIFLELEEAMREKDFTTTSDILNYEIKPLLEAIRNIL